ENRARIDRHPAGRARRRADEVTELDQPWPDHVVIVAASRVAGNKTPLVVVTRIRAHVVAHGNGDDRATARQQARRIEPVRAPAIEIAHRARVPGVEPRLERVAVLRGLGGAERDSIEAELSRPGLHHRAERETDQAHALRAFTISWARVSVRPPSSRNFTYLNERRSTSHRSWSPTAAARPSSTEAKAFTSRSTSRCSTAKPVRLRRRRTPVSPYAKREGRPVSFHWSLWSATNANTWPERSARLARSAIASDMQRYATTSSGLTGTSSSTSMSPTTKRTLVSLAAAALRRASSIARASRSTPTTARQSGARVSASRPEPVPASSTVRSRSGSARRRSRNAWLSSSPGSAGRVSAGDGVIGCTPDQARVFRQDTPRVARLRSLDALEPLLDLDGRKLDVEPALLDVDHDRVATTERGDRSALGRFRRDVADHEAVGRAGESPIGHQCDGVAEAGALE